MVQSAVFTRLADVLMSSEELQDISQTFGLVTKNGETN